MSEHDSREAVSSSEPDGSGTAEMNQAAAGDEVGQHRRERNEQRPGLGHPAIAVIAALVTVASGIFYLTSSGRDEKHTIEGVYALLDPDGVDGEMEDCRGDGGYSDISGGQSIKVTNGTGDIIGTGTLRNLKTQEDRATIRERWKRSGFSEGASDAELDDLLADSSGFFCFMLFEADVSRSEFYEVQIGGGDRGNLSYSHSEMEAKDWQLSISIGN